MAQVLKASVVTLLFLASLLSLNTEGRAESVGSCDARKMVGFCYDYTGEGWNIDRAKIDCRAGGGEYRSSGCPENPVVGTCTYALQGKKELEIVYRFYKDAFTLKQAQMSCPGKFSAK